jgi:hypothetical protein
MGHGCTLALPVRSPQPEDGRDPFLPAESASPLQFTWLREPSRRQRLFRDQTTDRLEFSLEQDSGHMLLLTGMEVDDWSLETHSLREDDPLSVTQRVQANLEYRREDWNVRIETDSRLWANRDHFYTRCQMEGFEGEEKVFSKTWKEKIKRDFI